MTSASTWAAVFVFVLATLVSKGEGFKQEIWLFDANDNGLYFSSAAANLSVHSAFLPQVSRICMTGMWTLYGGIDFESTVTSVGNSKNASVVCNVRNMTRTGSLKHWAASETTEDAISLYEGDHYDKREIHITYAARTNIPFNVQTITASGTADWMLFEGPNLDGKSTCYYVPYDNNQFNWDYVSQQGLSTVGSVFKGCDEQKIKEFKAKSTL